MISIVTLSAIWDIAISVSTFSFDTVVYGPVLLAGSMESETGLTYNSHRELLYQLLLPIVYL